jgi:aminoglycoside 3-N-acetyltransferase
MHTTSLKDLTQKIIRLGIPSSSTVMIHSSLLKFGIIENGIEGFFQCISESLTGDHTILMPAFSFNFVDTGYWSARATKSNMGALTEYFRNLKGAVRSIHPFHSVVALGKYADDFAKCNSLSSFGKDSPFEKMLELDSYNLSLGTEFVGGTTFVHYTEEKCHVPYRYYKSFPGDVYDMEERKVDQIYKMYVRKITSTYEYDNNWEKVYNCLFNDGCFVVDNLNGAKIILSSMNKTHMVFKKYINSDPYFAAIKNKI